MSVIYNALKKTQDNRSQRSVEQHHQNTVSLSADMNAGQVKQISTRTVLIVALLSCAVLVLIITIVQRRSIRPFTPALANSKLSVTPPQLVTPKLVINGVFISRQKKMVMINNRLYSLGDSIYGKKIISIKTNRIELRNNHLTEVLDITV